MNRLKQEVQEESNSSITFFEIIAMLRTTFVSRPVKTTVPRTHDVLRRVAPLSSILDLSSGILRLPCRNQGIVLYIRFDVYHP